MRYFFDKSLYKQLKLEIEAQIQRVMDSGIPLSHIDGHLNIHLHPTVFAFLTELMPRYGITSFRLSRERLGHNLRFDRQRRIGKTVERIIFGALANHARPHLKQLGNQLRRRGQGGAQFGPHDRRATSCRSWTA